MTTPPADISDPDWVSWPAGARELILSQQEEIEELRSQLTALASSVASESDLGSPHPSAPQEGMGSGLPPLPRMAHPVNAQLHPDHQLRWDLEDGGIRVRLVALLDRKGLQNQRRQLLVRRMDLPHRQRESHETPPMLRRSRNS
jgi:hypothetical protein